MEEDFREKCNFSPQRSGFVFFPSNPGPENEMFKGRTAKPLHSAAGREAAEGHKQDGCLSLLI